MEPVVTSYTSLHLLPFCMLYYQELTNVSDKRCRQLYCMFPLRILQAGATISEGHVNRKGVI